MDLHIDVPWILQVAELAGAGDPAPDDYGVPVAAVSCHRAELLETAVYDGPYARAAALVHILGRCRWLERSNLAVAAATGVMYLEASGLPVKPTREDAAALRDLLCDPACTAKRIATLLRGWPQATCD
ncbi:fic family toxin-antitoxin system, toxin component [Streptomyces sp. NPDC021100]|uniref:fic family toxin-antitoxin system, toxin component n=1 Tax=Streptomyces sp. NPDC021100 TaxID=3365114 RepID=UPI00378BF7B9